MKNCRRIKKYAILLITIIVGSAFQLGDVRAFEGEEAQKEVFGPCKSPGAAINTFCPLGRGNANALCL